MHTQNRRGSEQYGAIPHLAEPSNPYSRPETTNTAMPGLCAPYTLHAHAATRPNSNAARAYQPQEPSAAPLHRPLCARLHSPTTGRPCLLRGSSRIASRGLSPWQRSPGSTFAGGWRVFLLGLAECAVTRPSAQFLAGRAREQQEITEKGACPGTGRTPITQPGAQTPGAMTTRESGLTVE